MARQAAKAAELASGLGAIVLGAGPPSRTCNTHPRGRDPSPPGRHESETPARSSGAGTSLVGARARLDLLGVVRLVGSVVARSRVPNLSRGRASGSLPHT